MDLQTSHTQHSLPGWVACRFDENTVETFHGGDIEDPEVRFPLASVTKTFTAHLCSLDPFKGLLDQPLKEVMPYFKLRDPDATVSMTPRDALCHYSGLAPHTSDWVDCPLSRKDYIIQRVPGLPTEGPFREKHRYSNVMYAVIGQWLEEIDGRSWEDHVSGGILDPLTMVHTQHIDEEWQNEAPPPYALSKAGDLQRIPPFFAKAHHLIAPASELIGSMPDLARWGQFLLSLDPGDERWQLHNQVSKTIGYGLGWRLDTLKGEPRVWHSGQCSGYTTLLSLLPHRKTGVAIATNRSHAVDVLQELETHLNSTYYLTRK